MRCSFSFGLAAALLMLDVACPAVAEEVMSKEIIAAKVRKQGYVCEQPKSAMPDPDITEPGAKGWMLECGNATYRVMLNPHAAAKIERVDQGAQ
jgi:hypothetical protein